MNDEPFYVPNRTPLPPRVSQPSELLFEFLRGHTRIRCDLRDHGEFGVEAMFLYNEEFFTSRTFHPRLNPARTPREMAISWAREERKAIEKGNDD